MNKFFKSEADRNLWIKLKAEFGRQFQVNVNHQPMRDIYEKVNGISDIDVATNQLEYDEKHGHLRITLEQLLTFSYNEFEEHLRYNHRKWCEKHFK